MTGEETFKMKNLRREQLLGLVCRAGGAGPSDLLRTVRKHVLYLPALTGNPCSGHRVVGYLGYARPSSAMKGYYTCNESRRLEGIGGQRKE